ncbi:MAG: phosphoesterase RecJ-like protein [Flavobacteriaceae bacterium]|jgi:phosphoesterase RecJ-like protein|tara:strand:- start:3488 stop:4519 length:1032 start_codon:yes stop_codon:yes gene_type:complete
MKTLSSLGMEQHFISDLQKHLETPQKIVIFPHKNPDGDALGSALAWMHFLIKNNHETVVISPNDYPNFLNWLPGQETVLKFTKDTKAVRQKIKTASLIFTLDFNVLSRVGDLEPLVRLSKATKIMIDHHETPGNYAELMYSDPKMSSTCEMVYNLIYELNKKAFTSDIANCLYTGIMTDTGSFRYTATTPNTHKAIAHLIEEGASITNIHQQVYDSASFSRLKLLGITLSNMKQIKNFPIVYMTLSQDELNACDYKKGDTEGFVNYGLSLEGIIFSCIMIENEQEGILKMSFRSQGEFSVNDFARTYFNGGGHHNAAGGMSTDSINDTVSRFENAIKEVASQF